MYNVKSAKTREHELQKPVLWIRFLKATHIQIDECDVIDIVEISFVDSTLKQSKDLAYHLSSQLTTLM